MRHLRDVKEKRIGINSENNQKLRKQSILYNPADRKRPHNDMKFLPEKSQHPKKVRFNLNDNETMLVDQLSQTNVFFRDLSS